jgi:topoisomerase (DNA) II binding protein 1
MYEWGNYEHAATLMSAMSECDTKLAKSVHRWRQKVQTSGKLAFEGWKVVLAADPARSEGYIRLLEAGGAKVLTAK